MLRRLSSLLERASRASTLLAVTLVYAWFLGSIMPGQSAQSRAYAGDWGAPDRQLFYTPDELYAELATWGEAGRRHYVDFRLGLDIAWALTYAGFLVIAIGLAARRAFPADDRRRWLNLVPLLPLACDLAENALGIMLVASYPTRLDALAWVAATLTTAKWLLVAGAHAVLVFVLAAALRRQLSAWRTD